MGVDRAMEDLNDDGEVLGWWRMAREGILRSRKPVGGSRRGRKRKT